MKAVLLFLALILPLTAEDISLDCIVKTKIKDNVIAAPTLTILEGDYGESKIVRPFVISNKGIHSSIGVTLVAHASLRGDLVIYDLRFSLNDFKKNIVNKDSSIRVGFMRGTEILSSGEIPLGKETEIKLDDDIFLSVLFRKNSPNDSHTTLPGAKSFFPYTQKPPRDLSEIKSKFGTPSRLINGKNQIIWEYDLRDRRQAHIISTFAGKISKIILSNPYTGIDEILYSSE